MTKQTDTMKKEKPGELMALLQWKNKTKKEKHAKLISIIYTYIAIYEENINYYYIC